MKVREKQLNSKMCIICGMDNDLGVKAQFYAMEDSSIMATFRFRPEHQSYPGRVHGGMITAMLDELAGRAYWCLDPSVYAVTMSLETKFRKPVPYDADLIGWGKVTKDSGKFYVADAEIRDSAGNVLADATVKYIKLPPKTISEADPRDEMVYLLPDHVTEL